MKMKTKHIADPDECAKKIMAVLRKYNAVLLPHFGGWTVKTCDKRTYSLSINLEDVGLVSTSQRFIVSTDNNPQP